MWKSLLAPVTAILVAAAWSGLAARTPSSPVHDSVLKTHLLVTWYGNPKSPRMGVLGRHSGAERAEGLRTQAMAYQSLTTKRVMAGYELVAVVAQDVAGADGLWRRRESSDAIDALLQEARSNGFALVLDVQVGHSTVPAELAYLRPYLEQPDVHLALDPEFDMAADQRPGVEIGHMPASDVTYAMSYLGQLVVANHLPNKVLIVHQFTTHMLPDRQQIGRSPFVDVVLDMDGFGSQPLKLDTYRTIMKRLALQFTGVKLFYEQDVGLLTPAQVMQMKPVPSVVIYQ